MRIVSQSPRSRRGFTLIELLLVTVLLLLLVSATVFNFSAVGRGAGLLDGASQFEALLRYVRAHAANTGRQVSIAFQAAPDLELSGPPASVWVSWEPDPVSRPGQFEPLIEATPYLEAVNERVQIEDVRVEDPGASSPTATEELLPGEPDDASPPADEDFWILEDFDTFLALPSIRIFPDGSSDSATVVLTSREPEDRQRIEVRLDGLTGVIRRSVVEDPTIAAIPATEPPPEPAPIPDRPPARPAVATPLDAPRPSETPSPSRDAPAADEEASPVR
jgi:prepilin-type N-terminal cleavage/methylation domain-containing protein